MLAAAALGCSAASGRYVWVDQYEDRAGERAYLLGPGDLLSVRIYGQDAMSSRVRVRADGRISLPFLSDVDAAGYSPAVLAEQIQTRLKEVLNQPVVTVSVEEMRPRTVSVLGEVTRPGQYALEAGWGTLQALASAGGLTEFARRDRIFVLRRADKGEPVRIRITYDSLSRAEGRASAFLLAPGDVVVVE
jgi:polysaccharide export outer membrane protein